MEERKLYVPSNVPTESEMIRGYGKRQLRQAVIGGSISAALALIAWLTGAATILVILIAIIGISTSCILARKESNGLSTVDTIADNLRFLFQMQHSFYAQSTPVFRRKKEDRNEIPKENQTPGERSDPAESP